MNSSKKAKQFTITKREVYQAWLHVRSNAGACGVDGESIASFEAKLSKNLYKLWNRMSSGSYFPKAVKRVEIPKKDGGVRSLGVPTVSDRISQEVVRVRLEPLLEGKFHEDSYGYRPRKSGLDAVRTCRERNWKYDWVVDVDIQKFFDSINHDLLLKAVAIHCQEKWMMLYIERWLKAAIRHPDGREETCTCGTPQGGVISPLLANIFLHYAFDKWIEREFPSVKFERYADDIVIHCSSEDESHKVSERLKERLLECGLKLHPDKTKIVYCKDGKRKADYPITSYTFLGYTFQARSARSREKGKLFTGFLPAASKDSKKGLCRKLKAMRLRSRNQLTIEELAAMLNPTLRGWFNYFKHFFSSSLSALRYDIDRRLTRWARNKYRWNSNQSCLWLDRLKKQQPKLFAHW